MSGKPAGKRIKTAPSLRGHIWLEGSEGIFLGYGRVALIERIKEYGSITEAAKSLEIPYRKAWFLVDSMNRKVPRPFVVARSGGRKGGGTLVTPEGEKAIRMFRKIHDNFQEFIKSQSALVGSICKSAEGKR